MTWWRAARTVAGKDTRDLLREKTILVAVAVQFFIAAFSAFLLFGLQGLYDPASLDAQVDADIAYLGPGGFDEHLRDVSGFRVEIVGPSPDADRFDVVVVEYDLGDGNRLVDLLVPREGVTTALVVTRIQSLLEGYEHDLRLAAQGRIDTPALALEPAGSPAFAFAHGTLLPLLVIIPAFLAGSIAGDSFAQEIQNKTLLALRSAPAPLSAIVAGKAVVAVLLAPAQAALWLLLLAANGFAPANPGLILAAVTAIAAVLAAVAVAVAVLVRREGATQATYAAAAITLAVASQFLPREPLNLIARLGAGPADAVAVQSITWIAVVGLLGLVVVGVAGTIRLARRET